MKIKLLIFSKTGRKATLEVTAPTKQQGELSEHEVAGILFAVEFAINQYASCLNGDFNIRAHIEQ